MNQNSTINQRIDELVKTLFNGNNSKFAEIIGTSEANVRNYRSTTSPKWEILKAIHDKLEISYEWLLNDKGDKFKSDLNQYIDPEESQASKIEESSLKIIHVPPYHDKIEQETIVPLYNIDAAANLKTIFDNKTQNIIDTIRIPNMPKCDGAICVRGDSMYPLLKSGDIVIYKEVYDFSLVVFGEMYLVDFSLNDDDFLVVKYVNKSDRSDKIKLVSYNTHHDPLDIPLTCIRAMALVKASIRFNTMF